MARLGRARPFAPKLSPTAQRYISFAPHTAIAGIAVAAARCVPLQRPRVITSIARAFSALPSILPGAAISSGTGIAYAPSIVAVSGASISWASGQDITWTAGDSLIWTGS